MSSDSSSRVGRLRKEFDVPLQGLTKRIVQLDEALTRNVVKASAMDKLSTDMVAVARESSQLQSAFEALMRCNPKYALFVYQSIESLLAGKFQRILFKGGCGHSSSVDCGRDDTRVNEERRDDDATGVRPEMAEMYSRRCSNRLIAEQEMLGVWSDAKFRSLSAGICDKCRRTSNWKYFAVLWCMAGQKCHQAQGRSVSAGDSLSSGYSGRKKPWRPTGFELVDIIGILYKGISKNEELRRLITKSLDAELRLRLREDANSASASTAAGNQVKQR